MKMKLFLIVKRIYVGRASHKGLLLDYLWAHDEQDAEELYEGNEDVMFVETTPNKIFEISEQVEEDIEEFSEEK